MSCIATALGKTEKKAKCNEKYGVTVQWNWVLLLNDGIWYAKIEQRNDRSHQPFHLITFNSEKLYGFKKTNIWRLNETENYGKTIDSLPNFSLTLNLFVLMLTNRRLQNKHAWESLEETLYFDKDSFKYLNIYQKFLLNFKKILIIFRKNKWYSVKDTKIITKNNPLLLF